MRKEKESTRIPFRERLASRSGEGELWVRKQKLRRSHRTGEKDKIESHHRGDYSVTEGMKGGLVDGEDDADDDFERR